MEAQPKAGSAQREKRAIVDACEAFIAKVLKPRFLPEIKPSDRFNYAIDIRGDWRAGRYRFMRRYRAGGGPNDGEEFDAPFARVDRLGRDRFAICWMRHTGEWMPFQSGLTLAEAFELIQTVNVLHPELSPGAMTEYQYYEFQAIDRPVDEADREALRALWSRAKITATSFANEYNFGDFRGDPDILMERWSTSTSISRNGDRAG